MKTTKFTLDFKDLNLKSIAHNSARKAGKSLNQYILDCVLGDDPIYVTIRNSDGVSDGVKATQLIDPHIKVHADNCPCLMCNPKKK